MKTPKFTLDIKNLTEVEKYCRLFIGKAWEILNLTNTYYWDVSILPCADSEHRTSVSIQYEYGRCAITVNTFYSDTLEKIQTHLIHELGHCEAMPFYKLIHIAGIEKNKALERAVRIAEEEHAQRFADVHTQNFEMIEVIHAEIIADMIIEEAEAKPKKSRKKKRVK